MKYKTGQYAEALVDALADVNSETARTRIRSFVELLSKRQMLRKAESIAHTAERLLAKRAGVRRISLESADAPSEACRKDIGDLFDGKVWIKEKVRPDLLCGIRVLIDDEILIDASGKRQLAQIFQTESRV